MRKKIYKQEETAFKKLFQSIPEVKPSDDFTLSVMEKISKEEMFLIRRPSFFRKIYLLTLFPAGILVYFTSKIIERISWTSINIPDFNFSFLNDWYLQFSSSLQISATPAMVSIMAASFMLVILFAIVNSKNAVKV